MTNVRSCFVIILVLVLAKQLTAQQRQRVDSLITEEEAIALVQRAARGAGSTKLPGFGIEQSRPPAAPDYLFFDATWDNPDGSVVAGHYAVDRRTGDVWDSVVCQEFTSAPLRRYQTILRRRHRISTEEYRKLRRLGPMC
jgi:hypothetical protein